jgi:hypothetical protein
MSSSEVIGASTSYDAESSAFGPARRTLLRPGSPVPVYIGIALCLLGFALLAYTWGRVADEVQVYKQIPYLVSGGFTGLGLVLVGVTIVNVAAKRADAADRERQHDQLTAALRELHSALAGDSR